MTTTRQQKRQLEIKVEFTNKNLNKKQKLETILERNTVEVGINTDKQLKDYKILVFDLDNTLYLHHVDQIYSETYHKKVKNFLMYLKDNDKLLYIATHNFHPDNYLNKINVPPLLFDGIIKETKDVHPSLNSIMEYTSKKDMVLEILDKHKNLTKDDIIFFDDHMYNIKEVEKLNVKSIYVNEMKGIDFSEI